MVNGDNKDCTTNMANMTNEDFLKKYSTNSDPISDKGEDHNTKDINSSVDVDTDSKRLRTFSETLKMLDDDIVADLNVK